MGNSLLNKITYSIIIPNYNGLAFLEPCLSSLQKQTYLPTEVIVVDDGSRDDSVTFLKEAFPWVRIIERKVNGGFATACNDGIDAACSDIIILLNNDTEVADSWLEAIDKALIAHPEVAMVACKILTFNERDVFHSAGDYYRSDGIPGNRGVWQKDRGQYDQAELIFGPCGAAAVYRRSALDEVRADNENGRVLDESLFMYIEETDLNLRLQLRGYNCLYVPEAVVWHQVSATAGGELSNYCYTRNVPTVALKNLPTQILVPNLPFFVLLQLIITVKALARINQKTARAQLRGQLAALRALPQTLKQRQKIQATCRVDKIYLEKILWYNLWRKRLKRTTHPSRIIVEI